VRTAREFWACVRKVRGGCWLWTDATQNRYGRVFWKGRMTYAHRVAFELATGCAPPPRTKHKRAQMVLHSCDVPLCVNPDHLRLGTMADNMRDRDERNRANPRRGEQAPHSKLTAAQVSEVLALLERGCGQREVARLFGVTQPAISYIRTGRNWKHLKQPESLPNVAD
jgi:predicted XRE-type DNA-binding protein